MPQKQPSTVEDRPLTDEERSLTRWMLEHGKPEALAFLPQLDHARVVSRCPCGCGSVVFAIKGQKAPAGTGMQPVADFVFGGDDDLCGIFVFAQAGLLAGLEVYGLAIDAPMVLPLPEQLRPFSNQSVA